jgi:hypothetical protein
MPEVFLRRMGPRVAPRMDMNSCRASHPTITAGILMSTAAPLTGMRTVCGQGGRGVRGEGQGCCNMGWTMGWTMGGGRGRWQVSGSWVCQDTNCQEGEMYRDTPARTRKPQHHHRSPHHPTGPITMTTTTTVHAAEPSPAHWPGCRRWLVCRPPPPRSPLCLRTGSCPGPPPPPCA